MLLLTYLIGITVDVGITVVVNNVSKVINLIGRIINRSRTDDNKREPRAWASLDRVGDVSSYEQGRARKLLAEVVFFRSCMVFCLLFLLHKAPIIPFDGIYYYRCVAAMMFAFYMCYRHQQDDFFRRLDALDKWKAESTKAKASEPAGQG